MSADKVTITFKGGEDFGFGIEEISGDDGMYCAVGSIKRGSQAAQAFVKKGWVISRVNEELLIGMLKSDIVSALEQENSVCESVKIEFWKPSHEEHPYSHHYHLRDEGHVVGFALEDEDTELPCTLSYCYGNRENFMVVSDAQESPYAKKTGLRRGHCLSGIGSHNVFNDDEATIRALIKDHARPVQLAFLSVNHSFHPYTRLRGKMPSVEVLQSVFCKSKYHWQKARIPDVDRVLGAYKQTVQCFDEGGYLPIHCAIQNGASLEVVEYLASLHPESLGVCTDDGDLPLHLASYWGRNGLILFLRREYPHADNMKTPSGMTADDLAARSMFSNNETRELLKQDMGADGKGGAKEKENVDGEQDAQDTPVPDKDGWLPIHYAIRRGDTLENLKAIVASYLKCLKIPTPDGDFPLHLAAYWGRFQHVPFLLEQYPEAREKRTPAGNTPFDLASSSAFSNQQTIDLFNTKAAEAPKEVFQPKYSIHTS